MQQQNGFSNNFRQYQTQSIPQQEYDSNNFHNNDQFAYPNNMGNMNYQNQPFNQPQNQFYDNPYQNPDQNNPYGNSNNEDRPPQGNDYRPRGAVELNSISVGFGQQNNGDANPRKMSDEVDGLSNWNAAQPDQDSKPRDKESKSEANKGRKNIRSLTRSLSKWSTSGRSGIIMSTLGLCGTFVILWVLIGLMIFHFGKKDVKLTSVSGGLSYMAFNLNSDPIMQLTWAQNDCPFGTDKIHLGAWPGSDIGCDCPITGVSRGSCTRKEDYICSDVSDINPIDVFKWESAVFCAKRAQLGTDYIKTTSCPPGYKECSSSLCFVETLSCPISSITFSNTGDSSAMLAANKYVIFSNASGNAPIIDLDVSLNDVPCFSNTEIPKGKGDYILLKHRPEGCLAYGVDAEYSIKIDQMNENNLLINNGLPSKVFELPDYQQVLNAAPTVLSGRRRISVANKDECLAIKTETLNNAGSAAGDLNRYMSGTAITAIILHSCLFISVFASILGIKKNNSWKSIFSGEGAGAWLCQYLFFTFCEFIVYIVMVALVKSARSHLLDSKGYLVELDQMGCFPEGAPRQVIADYDDLVDQVASKLNGLAVALLLLTILTYFPVMFILCYKKYRKS